MLDAYAAGATIRAVHVARALPAPALAEPLAPMRHAAHFEALRAALPERHAHVQCIAVGDLAELSARGTWAANALASVGFVTSPLAPAPTLDAAFAALGDDAIPATMLFVLPDAAFAHTLEPALLRARALGVRALIVAGHPKHAPASVTPDAWLHLGVDLLAALRPIVRTLEDAA